MTPLSWLAARLASRHEHLNAHRRLVSDMAALTLGYSLPETGPRVGIATFGSGEAHLALESLLGHALAQRGARPELLVCDLPDLPICDERTLASHSRERCDGCFGDKRDLLEASRLPYRRMSEFVSADAVSVAQHRVAAIPDADLEHHIEHGWPIGQWLHVSACHYLRADARGTAPEQVDVRRRLLASAVVVTNAVERWLDTVRPEIVIAESGAHFMWRIAGELARGRGIRVVYREIGKGGFDHHLYSLGSDCMAPPLDDAWSDVRDVPLSTRDDAAVQSFLERLPAVTFGYTAPGRDARPSRLRERLGVLPNQVFAVAFSNVTWDLATAGRDVAFAGCLDWIRDCIAAVDGNPDVHLLVRVHPAEAHVWTRERLSDRIRADLAGAWPHNLTVIEPEDSLSAPEVFGDADVVLVYNSTAGLEAAAAGRRVVVCGAPHFRGRGFTHDMTHRSELRRWLSRDALSHPPASAEHARRWVFLFYLRYHMRMHWTTSPLSPPIALILSSLADLRPGANAAVDAVCHGILAGAQPLLPAAVAAEAACAP